MHEAQFPSIEQIVEYVLGRLDQVTARRITTLAARHNDVRDAVNEVREVVTTIAGDESLEPPESMVRKAVSALRRHRGWRTRRTVIARRTFDGRQPCAAGLRGAAGAYDLTYESEFATIDLRMSARAAAEGPWRILGQISDHDGPPDPIVAVRRHRSGEEFAWTRADDRGRFGFDAGRGAYDLVIELDAGSLVLEEIEVG